MPYDAAVAEGAIALVRREIREGRARAALGDFSMELCGGTHVARAATSASSRSSAKGGVQAGVRRIEAITAEGALDYVEPPTSSSRTGRAGARHARRREGQGGDALERIRQLEKENRSLKDKLASGQGTDLSAGARDIAGVKLVAAQVDGADAGALRNAVDQLKDKLKSAVIVLASVDATNKITLVAGVTADQAGKVKAGELVGNVAGQVGGKGGGRRISRRPAATIPRPGCGTRQRRSLRAHQAGRRGSLSTDSTIVQKYRRNLRGVPSNSSSASPKKWRPCAERGDPHRRGGLRDGRFHRRLVDLAAASRANRTRAEMTCCCPRASRCPSPCWPWRCVSAASPRSLSPAARFAVRHHEHPSPGARSPT
jgi:hypothetical protein